MMEEGEHQYLKELALEYVRLRNPLIFEAIIIKVDKLLMFTIRKVRAFLPYLRAVEIQDLYQDAIVGLHKGLLKVKEDEPDTKVLYWIVRNVTDEIVKCNRRVKKSAQSFEKIADEELVDTTPVYKDLELAAIRERFWKLMDEGVLSFDEFQMLIMRVIHGMTYKDIAKQFGSTKVTVSKRIKDVLNRLRHEFRRRNWEGI
jgi:RNA polymerase sigma factor (sigma-70 family)